MCTLECTISIYRHVYKCGIATLYIIHCLSATSSSTDSVYTCLACDMYKAGNLAVHLRSTVEVWQYPVFAWSEKRIYLTCSLS